MTESCLANKPRSEARVGVPGAKKLMNTAFGRDSQGIIACSGDNLRVCKL
jgi:hypothetical protein